MSDELILSIPHTHTQHKKPKHTYLIFFLIITPF